MADRCTIIRPSPSGSGLAICVEPPPEWARYDAERPTHRDAIRYATSLRTVHGWRVVDESAGCDG